MATVRAEIAGDVEDTYRQEAGRLWRAVYLYAGDAEVASDAVAEAFAQLLRRGAAVRDPRAWVWRAGFRIAGGELKRRRLVEPLSAQVPMHVPDDVLELTEALTRLSKRQRASLVLYYYGGYSLSEIATIIGSTRSAVSVHLDRGRKRLRQVLGGSDV
jgi:RNA polymerase sigma-70 factor (ECF subfamily)